MAAVGTLCRPHLRLMAFGAVAAVTAWCAGPTSAFSAGARDASVIVDLSVLDAAGPQAGPGDFAVGQSGQLLLPGSGEPVSRLYLPAANGVAPGVPASAYGNAGLPYGRLIVPTPRTLDAMRGRSVALTRPGAKSPAGGPRVLAGAAAMPRPSSGAQAPVTPASSSTLFPPPQGFTDRPTAARSPSSATQAASTAAGFAAYPPPEPLAVAAHEPAPAALAERAASGWAFSPARRPKSAKAGETGAPNAQRAAVLAPVQPAAKPDNALKLAVAAPVRKASPGERFRLIYAANQIEMPAPLRRELEPVVTDLRKNGVLRVQLAAYAGTPADLTSKARRTSLSRALSIRSFLIENGIRASRIDVRALGNKSGASAPERVDVEVIGK